MSALLTPTRRRTASRDSRRDVAAPQPSLLDTAARATTADDETSTTPRAHRQGPTLDDLVAGAWEGLLAGAPVDCPACGTVMAPRQSAGAGVVGGRCGGCGSTLG